MFGANMCHKENYCAKDTWYSAQKVPRMSKKAPCVQPLLASQVHPDHGLVALGQGSGALYWSHHEKLVLVDGSN